MIRRLATAFNHVNNKRNNSIAIKYYPLILNLAAILNWLEKTIPHGGFFGLWICYYQMSKSPPCTIYFRVITLDDPTIIGHIWQSFAEYGK